MKHCCILNNFVSVFKYLVVSTGLISSNADNLCYHINMEQSEDQTQFVYCSQNGPEGKLCSDVLQKHHGQYCKVIPGLQLSLPDLKLIT